LLLILESFNLYPYLTPFGGYTKDFIEALAKSKGKEIILVVIDRLTKYAHLIDLSHPYTTLEMAQAFMENVYKLRCLPQTIIFDSKIISSTFLDRIVSKFVGLSIIYIPPTIPKLMGNQRS